MFSFLANIDPWAVLMPGSATGAVIFCIWMLNRERREDRKEWREDRKELVAAMDRLSASFQELANEIRERRQRPR